MLLTPQQELRNAVDVLNTKNFQYKIFEDGQQKRLRASFYTSKRDYFVELLVKNRLVGLRVKNSNHKTREADNELLLSKMRVQHLFQDRKLSSAEFPTFVSNNIVEDFVKIINTIEQTAEFEDSTGNTWKINGGLEKGTWYIVDCIRSAVAREHTSALGRDMYECLRGQVSVNRYDSDAGKTWGEHCVPIDFLTQELVRMCTQGASESEMFDFLMRNHKVMYITPKQANTIDSGLKLQTTMTEGWNDGDSPFARLEAANIIIEE